MRPYANASQVVQLDHWCRCERHARNGLGRRSCEHERDGVPVAAAARAARQQREESERKHSSRQLAHHVSSTLDCHTLYPVNSTDRLKDGGSRHTRITDEPHNHPNPRTHPHDRATTVPVSAADSTAAAGSPDSRTLPRVYSNTLTRDTRDTRTHGHTTYGSQHHTYIARTSPVILRSCR